MISLGKKTGNVGITRLQARRSLLDPIGYEILVEVANASDEPASFRLELDLDEDPIDVVPMNLAAGERSVHVFEKTSAEGGRLHASIDRSDSLLTDNSAWAILPHRARQKVILVTPGNLFLEKVFEAIPLVDLEVVKVAKDAPLPADGSQPWAGVSHAAGSNEAQPIVIFHHKVPDALPPAQVLVIEPERSGALWELGDAVQNPLVAKQDKDSPLMLNIRLDNVLMPEARKLTLRGPAQVLAESSAGDPLYAVLERSPGAGEGKVVVLTVNLDKSDLPLQTAFPIMMANLLSWFGGTKGELREALAAGAVAQVEIPPGKDGSAERFLVAPDGREQPLFAAVGASRLTVGPLDRCGVWSVVERAPAAAPGAKKASVPADDSKAVAAGPGNGRQETRLTELACNLADRRESDLRPAEGLPARDSGLAAGIAVRPIWYYLLASALMLDLLGVVLVSAEVDRLMGSPSLASPIGIELSRPWWLLGLLALPILFYFFRRSLVEFARWQRLCSLWLRGLIVLLLVLALAGLSLVRPTRELFVVFAVDRSESVGEKGMEAIDTFLGQAFAAAGGNRFAVLPFASEPGTVEPGASAWEALKKREAAHSATETARAGSAPAVPADAQGLDRKGTDLAAAIEVAAAAVPPFYVPRIVLVSDGNPTRGDALQAAASLRGKVEVLTVPLPGRTEPEVQLSSVGAPAQVLQGEPFNVEVVIDSNHDDEKGRVEVFRGDIKVADQPVKLKKGENKLALKQTIDAGGLTPLTARLKGYQDTLLDNNSDFALVSAAGKPRVLLLESDPDQAKHLTWALEEQNMQVDVRPPRGAPENLAELQNYDLFILSNVPATALSLRQMEVARTYVQDLGGGLDDAGGRPVVRPGRLLQDEP